MTQIYEIIYQAAANEDWRESFQLLTDSGPQNLAGGALKMLLIDDVGATVLSCTSDNGRLVVIDAVNGKFDLLVPVTAMSALRTGSYRHDCVLSVAGSTRRLWYGRVTIIPGVSR